ncbi:hypothetical protein FQP90_04265 [Paenarthrobacter nitroguajacolicus]|uniref:DUF1461 domain-containing protein n=1 Tax=Paenarthrobacter nitroguajacolicus TaxID=211146 RepID=A0A558H8H9_PAENT|nr:hypothetical protein [Paenarthrobacter nitroguajacolicus]TVU65427.1 hypothetical protein FQP90_04265 [Paenarthrobacter nitroguajacolicus]
MTLRTFVSALGVILALLLTAVAVPAAWVDQNIVKEEGFVRIAGGLGNDPDFQSRLAAAAVGTFESSVDLPGPIQSLAADALRNAATGMQSWSDYPAAWEETVRNSHRLNFGAAPQTEEAATTTALVLDIGPLVRLIRDHFAEATRIRLDVPAESLVSLGEPSHRQLVERVAAFAPLWWLAAAGALLASLRALAAARRRSLVLVFLGLGGLALAALWTAGSDLAGGIVGNLASANGVAELFKQEFLTTARTGFGQWTLIAAVVSGVVLVVGIIGSVVSGRQGSRSARS